MKYKIIFSDFDGTVSRSDNTVSEKVKAAVAEYVKKGGKFVLVTGRLFSAVRPRAAELGLHGEAVVYQGGGIYDLDSGKPLYLNSIPTDRAVFLLKALEKLNYCETLCYFDDKCNCARPSEYVDYFCQICGVPYYSTDMPLSEYVEKNGTRPVKILSLMMPEHTEEFLEYGRSVAGREMVFTRSHKSVVEILPRGINKGAAIKRICEKYGVDKSEVIALGDSENDASMLEFAGLGIAAGNAMPALKAIADEVGVTNDEDFVAWVIEKYGEM